MRLKPGFFYRCGPSLGRGTSQIYMSPVNSYVATTRMAPMPWLGKCENNNWANCLLTPPCVAESDQRHAQHPLKMLGIDFSCGSYQTNSERIMLLNSWYQIDMSLYSNRYLFVRSKIGGQKWQPHILCKTMSFFASRLTPWFAWQPRAPAQKTTRADMQILYSLLS